MNLAAGFAAAAITLIVLAMIRNAHDRDRARRRSRARALRRTERLRNVVALETELERAKRLHPSNWDGR